MTKSVGAYVHGFDDSVIDSQITRSEACLKAISPGAFKVFIVGILRRHEDEQISYCAGSGFLITLAMIPPPKRNTIIIVKTAR